MKTPLQTLAETVAGHIIKPMTMDEIVAEIDGAQYNAELMLQHLILWAADVESALQDPHRVRAMVLFGHIVWPNDKGEAHPCSASFAAWLHDYFRAMRFDPSHHLGLGDIRLTISQQDDLVVAAERAHVGKPNV